MNYLVDFDFKLQVNTFPTCILQDLSRGVLEFLWFLQDLCCLTLEKINVIVHRRRRACVSGVVCGSS